jgi:hypothetical protein
LSHFDAILHSHYHFICKNCHKIYDIRIPAIKELDEKVRTMTGFRIYSHRLEFFGLCDACNTRQGARPTPCFPGKLRAYWFYELAMAQSCFRCPPGSGNLISSCAFVTAPTFFCGLQIPLLSEEPQILMDPDYLGSWILRDFLTHWASRFHGELWAAGGTVFFPGAGWSRGL